MIYLSSLKNLVENLLKELKSFYLKMEIIVELFFYMDITSYETQSVLNCK